MLEIDMIANMGVIKMILKNDFGGALILCSLIKLVSLIQINAVYGQNTRFTIYDCKSSQPLEDCFIYNDQGILMAISDEQGIFQLYNNQIEKLRSITIRKIGFDSLTIQPNAITLNKLGICLNEQALNLDSLYISSARIDSKKELIKYTNAARNKINVSSEYIRYSFTYRTSFLSSEERDEKLSGTLIVPNDLYMINSFSPFFYEYLDYSADTVLLNNEHYRKLPGNRIRVSLNTIFSSKSRYVMRMVRKSKKVDFLDSSDPELIGFKHKTGRSRNFIEHLFFQREDSILISREYFSDEVDFSIYDNKLDFISVKELYSNEVSGLLISFSFIEQFLRPNGDIVQIQLELRYIDDHKHIDIDNLIKVKIGSFNNELIPFCRNVSLY